VGKSLHVQGAPPGGGDVPGKSVQLSRKTVWLEMLRVSLHRVSTYIRSIDLICPQQGRPKEEEIRGNRTRLDLSSGIRG